LRDTADDSRLEAFTVHTLTVIDGDDDGDRGIIEMTVMITNGWPPLEILDTGGRVRARIRQKARPLTSVLFPSGSRDRKTPSQPFFPRALVVAQKRSFTVLAGHVHSRPRTRRPALLFLMTACQKTGADFHGPRAAAWQPTLARLGDR